MHRHRRCQRWCRCCHNSCWQSVGTRGDGKQSTHARYYTTSTGKFRARREKIREISRRTFVAKKGNEKRGKCPRSLLTFCPNIRHYLFLAVTRSITACLFPLTSLSRRSKISDSISSRFFIYRFRVFSAISSETRADSSLFIAIGGNTDEMNGFTFPPRISGDAMTWYFGMDIKSAAVVPNPNDGASSLASSVSSA